MVAWGPATGSAPVSYTHLDVYKRQIYEDDAFRAILDIGPASRGHVLILPKEHAEDFLRFRRRQPLPP